MRNITFKIKKKKRGMKLKRDEKGKLKKNWLAFTKFEKE